MKRQLMSAVLAMGGIGGGVVLGTVVPASASTACPSQGTTSGSVIVGRGVTCSLDGNTVNGNVVVRPGGTLQVLNSTITGSVVASGAVGANYLCATNVGGNVVVTHLPASPTDPFTVPTTYFVLNNDNPFGDPGCYNFSTDHDHVGGSVVFAGNKSFTALVSANVGKNVVDVNNTGDYFFSSTDILSDVIGENLVCFGNNPPPFGGADMVGGSATGQCSTFTQGNLP